MKFISYTDNYYLYSAVRYLFSSESEKEAPINCSIDAKLSVIRIDYVFLFNDLSPAESLFKLSTHSGFESGDIVLVISDVVSAEVIRYFIQEECWLIVQTGRVKLSDWLNPMRASTERKRICISSENRRKHLFTHGEKIFLNTLKINRTPNFFSKGTEAQRKKLSAYKRSVMRKLEIHHTQQLLDYINADCFLQMLEYL